MTYPPLGAQLIVFEKQTDLERNTAAALDAVRAAGFEAIECGAAFHAADPAAFKAMLDQRGLRVAGLHGALALDLDLAFKLLDVYGARDLCISGLGNWGTCNSDVYLKDVEQLNALARQCAAHGVYTHYHNHAYEFAPTSEGPSGMDLIMGDLDYTVADLCVDVAWVHIGGHDPAMFLRKYADHIGYVHLKDYIGDRHWVPLGQGRMPFDSVMKALPALKKARWVVYEQDTSERPAAEACAISRQYLAKTYGY